jgi:hypothetical protein
VLIEFVLATHRVSCSQCDAAVATVVLTVLGVAAPAAGARFSVQDVVGCLYLTQGHLVLIF